MQDSEVLHVGGRPLTVRDVTVADMPEVMQLHLRIFGSEADPAWFTWKYVQGRGEAVGAWQDGQLIAHSGGVPRQYRHGEARHAMLQIGDLMVAPEGRGAFTRQGPFYHVSKAMYDTRLGPGKRFHMCFGFPSTRALNLGTRLGLTWDIAPMIALQWNTPADTAQQPPAGLSKWRWNVAPLDPQDPNFRSAIQCAWQAMQRSTPHLMLGERDADYINWRFVQRPHHRASFLQLRRPWHRKPTGIAVVAPANSNDPFVQWLDWIGPPDLIPEAAAACRAEAVRTGAQGVKAWGSRAVVDKLEGSGISGQSETLHLCVAQASSTTQEAAAHLLWWLMGGDTDYL